MFIKAVNSWVLNRVFSYVVYAKIGFAFESINLIQTDLFQFEKVGNKLEEYYCTQN